jgi:hypothetical protein
MGLKVFAVFLLLGSVTLAFVCMGVLIEFGAPPWMHILPIAGAAAAVRPLARLFEVR